MTKEKREQLAFYLPFNLRLYHKGHKPDHILDITVKEGILDRPMSVITMESITRGYDTIKPLLYPFDLSKEIIHEEEKIIPEQELGCNMLDKSFREMMGRDVNNIPWGTMKKLFEWNIDVFGWIDEGFAVNINDLSEGGLIEKL